MRRLLAATTIALGTLWIAPSPMAANLLSKNYNFEADTTLEVGVTNDPGIRLDAVRFELPSTVGGRFFRTGGLVTVFVSLSNTSEHSQKVGVAIALFDDQARLVGVASGGSHWLPIKAGRQKSFKMIFDNVNGEAYKAKTFQISIESK